MKILSQVHKESSWNSQLWLIHREAIDDQIVQVLVNAHDNCVD